MKVIFALMLFILSAVSAGGQTPQVYGRVTDRIETGRVRKLSKDLLTFSPLPGGPDITVKVGPHTQVIHDNKPVEVKRIKRGNIVRVTFPISTGTSTAESITLLDKKNIPARK